MGCNGSKEVSDTASAPAATGQDKQKLLSATPDKGGDRAENKRLSVVHKSPEEADGGASPFDPYKIGSLSRHGIAPVRGGAAKAKINQDRGMVCWPFNGTHDQCLLAVFDGHGLSGEKISDWCTHQIPRRLEADRDNLLKDPVDTISRAVRARARMHADDFARTPRTCILRACAWRQRRRQNYHGGSAQEDSIDDPRPKTPSATRHAARQTYVRPRAQWQLSAARR